MHFRSYLFTPSCRSKELACRLWPDFAPEIVIRRFLTAVLFLCCASVYAQSFSLPQLTAKNTDTEPSSGDQIFTGDARLEYEGILLTSDQIRLNQQTHIATAHGHVVLTIDSALTLKSDKGRPLAPQGSKRLLADEIVFNIKEKSFTGTRLRFGEYPLFVSGSRIEGNPTDIVLYDAQLYYREPSPYSPALSAEKISIVSREKVVADKARIDIGDIPAIPFHRVAQSVEDPLISHMSARIGKSGPLGYFADLGFHEPTAPGIKSGGDIGYYSARGVLVGPSGTYDHVTGDQESSGSLETGYIHDHGIRGTDILGRPIHSDRGFLQWQDEHASLTKNFTMITQLSYWSDSGVVRDFRSREFYNVQQPDSFVDMTGGSDNTVVDLFFRLQPNTDYRVQQRLPEFRVDNLPSLFGNGFYSRSSFSFVALRERAFSVDEEEVNDTYNTTYTTYPTIKSNRLDWVYTLERPISPREYLVIDPVAGFRTTHYFDAVNGRAAYSRVLGEVGIDASLHASGVYDYKNEKWGIDGIRHLVTPTLSYRYIPAADKGKRYIPQVDTQVFDTALPTLELADQRNIDDLDATNVLRIGVNNTFQTRDKKYGSRDLLTFNIAGDYRFHRNLTEKDVSDIHTGVSFMPARWMQFDVYESFAPQNYTLREINTRLGIHDGSVWSASLSSHYLQHQIEEYVGEGNYRINEKYQTVLRLDYDVRKHRFNEQSIALRQNIDNVWSIQYGVNYYKNRLREGNFSYNIEIRLQGL